MRRIKIYAVTSMEGYISRRDGDIDWILELDNPMETDYGLRDFYDGIGTVLMNRNYYLLLRGYDLCFSVMERPTVIITEGLHESPAIPGVEYMQARGNDYTAVLERIRALKETEGGDIWCAGDNKLIWALLDADLVDEIILTMLPVTIGGGAKLFPDTSHETRWHTGNRKYYDNGVIQITYRPDRRGVN